MSEDATSADSRGEQASYFDGSFLSTSDIPIVDFRNRQQAQPTRAGLDGQVGNGRDSVSPSPHSSHGNSAADTETIDRISESFPSFVAHETRTERYPYGSAPTDFEPNIDTSADPLAGASADALAGIPVGAPTSPGRSAWFRPQGRDRSQADNQHAGDRQERGQQETTGEGSRRTKPMVFATSRTSEARMADWGDWRPYYMIAIALLDVIVVAVSFGLSYLLVRWVSPASLHSPLARRPAVSWLFVIICLSWLLAFGVCKLYATHVMDEGMEMYSNITNAALSAVFISCAALFIIRWQPPRGLFLVTMLIAYVLALVERWLMRRFLHSMRRHGRDYYTTVIVGSPVGIRRMIDKLASTPSIGYRPIAVCPIVYDSQDCRIYTDEFLPRNAGEEKLLLIPFNLHLPQNALKSGAHTLMVVDVIDRESELMRALALAAGSQGLELAMEAGTADIASSALHLRHNTQVPVLTAQLPQYSALFRLTKRLLDLLISTVGLILTSWIMLLTAIAIKVEDHGPAIYRQKRVGLYGKPFTIYKFRSMYVDADKRDATLAAESGKEHGVLFKLKDDPRNTKVGKFIRKTSIDELPQLWNVFKGDMSIVGPRPQKKYEVDQYGTLYATRLLVKPGITGLWQVSGRSNLGPEESEYLDVSYVENWSLTGGLRHHGEDGQDHFHGRRGLLGACRDF